MTETWSEPEPGAIKVSPQHQWVLRAWRWRLRERNGAVYVERKTSVRINGRVVGRRIQLGRQIIGLQLGDPREVDHRDGDPLNNTIDNLEIVTRTENNRRQHERRQRDAARAAADRDAAIRDARRRQVEA